MSFYGYGIFSSLIVLSSSNDNYLIPQIKYNFSIKISTLNWLRQQVYSNNED
jgi:hypothetical protein